MRIGVLADTHDRVLPALFDALAGVDELLHAGDICRAETLAEIETIAPVLAVHGNCDERKLAERLSEEERIEREGVRITIVHGHRAGGAEPSRLAAVYGSGNESVDLVVFGHSHVPCDVIHGRTRYFNPGTAGGVGRSPTVGILTLTRGSFVLEHRTLASAH